ncbi:MAG: MFS transporter [Phycisphaerales bacterium]|nr:MFS transporter [Phycisphaerales bacterium]
MTTSAGTSSATWTRRWALLLLVFAAVPDVLPYPGLKQLISERYGLDDIGAQLFAVAALIGALGAVPILRRLRSWSPRRIFASAALVQALAIGVMIIPIDWPFLLVLRGIQGYVDLLLLVTLTTLVAANAPSTGRGFGMAGSAIMVGLALGLVGGGVVSSISVPAVFPVGALVSLGLALGSLGLPSVPGRSFEPNSRGLEFDRKVITAGAFMASDRMIPGMMTFSLPLLLVTNFGATPMTISLIMSMPLLACAIGGYFTGMIVDRLGAFLVRVIGVPLQASGLALVVVSAGNPTLLVLGTLLLATGSALVMPTSLVIGTGRSAHQVTAESVGGIQALGQVGYLFGALSILIMTIYYGSVTNGIVLTLLLVYLAWNVAWLGRLRAIGHARRAPRFARGERRLTIPQPKSRVRRAPSAVESRAPSDADSTIN